MNTHPKEHAENKIAESIRTVLECIGEDVLREGIIRTPERVAKSLLFLSGGHFHEREVIEDCERAVFDEKISSSIAVNNIEFYSMCEHHMLPFWGTVSVSLIPNKDGKVLGLSKFGRLVDAFSRRLQVQERLGMQLIEVIEKILKPQAICVKVQARHMCMMMRGVEKHSSSTVTYEFRGNKTMEEGLKYLLE